MRRKLRPLPDDVEMTRHFAVAVAFSQGARSSSIRSLIREPGFAQAFVHFDPVRLHRLDPEKILARHWRFLSPIRFRGKVTRIVRCSAVLVEVAHEYGSFAKYLSSYRVPRRLRQLDDVDRFWARFDELQADLQARCMPFFRSTTSLLQLLLDLDYDSVKPDLILMRLARRIGIVEKETGEKNLRRVTRAVQEYAVARSVRAPVVDLHMLAFGGQTGSGQLLSERFCPASDPCRNVSCPVGVGGLCRSFLR